MSKQTNVSVSVREGEPIERSLRRFRRKCQRAGLRSRVKELRFYEKPSDARRRLQRKLERKQIKAARKAKRREQRRWARIRKHERVLGMLTLPPPGA